MTTPATNVGTVAKITVQAAATTPFVRTMVERGTGFDNSHGGLGSSAGWTDFTVLPQHDVP